MSDSRKDQCIRVCIERFFLLNIFVNSNYLIFFCTKASVQTQVLVSSQVISMSVEEVTQMASQRSSMNHIGLLMCQNFTCMQNLEGSLNFIIFFI